jgi:gas vesicle protein
MDERANVMLSAVAGALIGTAVGYLFFTRSGRALRDRIEPSMDELRREFGRFQRTLEKMGEVASEGLSAVHELRGVGSSFGRPSDRVSH